ncbi:colanic acid biosynthesis glycosyltransferase WcaI [Flavobacterium zepuense]|uniref:Colanic acid biosynthesis glycosyltransferase WcaI n=1 Tax=Flavobacterium zepuense TaxID=2593302 RepID=A0A552V2F2_9FLAO|nr:WcaI family glycosyltransferase [Flavobacterium zepuense]TRW24644.1 colanic acid biosynthesis glycosyltransferase WcaI [Flavobacterium zepuense]
MKIIIYGINYSPELTGIGKYTGEMGSWLAQQGHDVHVVTAMPYYPEWEVHEKYKGKKWHTEVIDGARVHRIPLYVPKEVSSAKRIIHEFTFILGLLPVWFSFLFKKKADVVFCIAPPFHLGFFPLIYSKLRGVPMVSHVQDLQVDAAKELGMIKNKTFLNIMFSLERFLLKKSAKVSTISLGMQQKIASKGIKAENQILFPNWVDENNIKPLPKEQSLRAEFGISNTDKVILYSGNLGEKQGLETIIETAVHYKDRNDVYFLIVGSGGAKEKLEQMVKDAALTQVKFYPLQPYEKLSALLATADAHLVLQKKSAADLVMPSKLTGILAAGGCSIVTAEPGTSLYHVIHEYNMGILTEPESATALKNSIDLAINSDLEVYKTNARKYAEMMLSKENILKDFENNLLSLN